MTTFIRCLILVSAGLLAVDGRASSIIGEIKKALEPEPYEKGDLIVNVNTGTTEELETIPCIGEKLAREIIRGRTYEKVEELLKVPGIGDFTYKCMLPNVKVEGPTERRKKPK